LKSDNYIFANKLNDITAMQSKAATPEEYVESLPEDRREAINKLRKVIRKNLPKGFAEEMSYGMIGYVVPHKLYPNGYHCDPKLPLPFLNIASQKNFIAVYHMGIYMNPKLLEWFTNEYPKHSKKKLDMGKSCLRFKKPDEIPYDLIGELASKVTVAEWVSLYEKALKN
jgi:uncharacterized protein YdhG (YjbR/CyaY superfamily)